MTPPVVHEIRAVPLWLLRDYFVEAGGEADGEFVVRGPGWTVTLEEMDDHRVGSLSVGQVRVTMDGDADAVAALWAVMEPKLIRGGG
ncbi:MAG: DUF1952 domain-containing protein [Planctomycetota bacterium]|jgi:hypothetical protein